MITVITDERLQQDPEKPAWHWTVGEIWILTCNATWRIDVHFREADDRRWVTPL